MRLNQLKWFLLISLCLFVTVVMAISSPLPLMQGMANQTLSFLQAHKIQLKNNPKLVKEIVNQVVVPHIDADRMAGAVVGRQYWQGATSSLRARFIQEFKQLVISTYSTAIASYDDDKIKFYPIRGGYANQATVPVRSVIIRKNGQRISIVYNLIAVGGQWKIYDFSIEGVSMVQSYRSQFADALTQGGLSVLVNRLIQYNYNRARR